MSNDAPGAFNKVTYNGKLMDNKTKAFVQAMEEKLGYSLTIVQGCYSGSAVSASGNTHNGGGVLDIVAYDIANKLRVLKDLGGFGWYRPTIAGLWGEHIHFGIRNHGNLDPSAARQQVSYDNHRNGLVSNSIDPTYRAKPPVTFVYDPKKKLVLPKANNVTKMRDALTESLHDVSKAIAFGHAVNDSRKVVAGQLDELVQIKKDLRATLEVLPKR